MRYALNIMVRRGHGRTSPMTRREHVAAGAIEDAERSAVERRRPGALVDGGFESFYRCCQTAVVHGDAADTARRPVVGSRWHPRPGSPHGGGAVASELGDSSAVVRHGQDRRSRRYRLRYRQLPTNRRSSPDGSLSRPSQCGRGRLFRWKRRWAAVGDRIISEQYGITSSKIDAARRSRSKRLREAGRGRRRRRGHRSFHRPDRRQLDRPADGPRIAAEAVSAAST